jgi:hypothetical protein
VERETWYRASFNNSVSKGDFLRCERSSLQWGVWRPATAASAKEGRDPGMNPDIRRKTAALGSHGGGSLSPQ